MAANFKKAMNLIEQIPWHIYLVNKNINKSIGIFKRFFLNIMELFILHVRCRRLKDLPWLSKSILRMMSRKRQLSNKAKKSSDPLTFQAYKRLRNKIISTLRRAKKYYIHNLDFSQKKNSGEQLKLLQTSLHPYLHCLQMELQPILL